MEGLWATVQISFFALVLVTLLGAGICAIRRSKHKILKIPASIYSEAGDFTDITDIIENTDGFDVVLDAHTHSVIEEMTVKDKSGDDVLLSSTGTKFEYIGKLIDAEGTLDIELLENYIVDHLGGTIGEEYAQSQGRITFTE